MFQPWWAAQNWYPIWTLKLAINLHKDTSWSQGDASARPSKDDGTGSRNWVFINSLNSGFPLLGFGAIWKLWYEVEYLDFGCSLFWLCQFYRLSRGFGIRTPWKVSVSPLDKKFVENLVFKSEWLAASNYKVTFLRKFGSVEFPAFLLSSDNSSSDCLPYSPPTPFPFPFRLHVSFTKKILAPVIFGHC